PAPALRYRPFPTRRCSRLAVLGAGAFGTAMAVTLARTGAPVGLWTREADHAGAMRRDRVNTRRLPGVTLPETVSVSAEIGNFSGDRKSTRLNSSHVKISYA